jgi:site-specific DNA recombinase
MQQSNGDTPYRAKRALMLLRVSSIEQKKGYGWASQEKEIRTKVIEPLDLRLDEERHIIRDVYTGLEFKEHPALQYILEMAERHEFDILVTDVLDRLGRKGIARELYRMQLREFGIRILTTDPQDHADDDTLAGETIRLNRGYQAEGELNNTRRRSMNAKRVKLEGNKEKGIAPVVEGSGHRYYGYKYVLDARGKRVGIELNYDVIFVDEDGTEWTEVRVVTYIFENAANGVTLREIAKFLNEKKIPTPYVAKGIITKNQKYAPSWQASNVSLITRNSVYYGEARFRKKRKIKVRGKKDPRVKTPESEQLVVPVPAIVSKELAEKACMKAAQNKKFASGNNPNHKAFLLRGGLAKCGHCGGSLTTQPHHYKRKDGSIKEYTLYVCMAQGGLNHCHGCTILTTLLDKEAWSYMVALIRKPTLVDEKIAALRKEDPTANRRKQINAKLQEIRAEQANMEKNLTNLMRKGTLNARTEERLTQTLNALAEEEEGYLSELTQDDITHAQWKKVEDKLDEIHQVCREMSEKLDDPLYTPSYQKKQDLLVYLGIRAVVWHKEKEPKYEIQCKPPDIVSILSFGELQ